MHGNSNSGDKTSESVAPSSPTCEVNKNYWKELIDSLPAAANAWPRFCENIDLAEPIFPCDVSSFTFSEQFDLDLDWNHESFELF